jgi:microsomal dipeptidase-like Zn-dependent dipeptidase
MQSVHGAVLIPILALALAACSGDDDDTLVVERPPAPANDGVYGFAHGCYTMDATAPGSSNTRWLALSADAAGYSLTATTAAEGARFRLQPADLGTYLFYDAQAHYLLTDDAGALARAATLESDLTRIDDTFRSPAEWTVEPSVHDGTRFQLRHQADGRYLDVHGALVDGTDDAAVVAFYPADGCADFPEMAIDSTGEVMPRTWPDGDVYGIVDTHEHMFTNFGFGGGGIFHGSPFHRLGVEHALSSCELFHGPEGRADIVGYAFGGLSTLDADGFLDILAEGMTPGFDHHPDGWPTFTDWPKAWKLATHQAQYYRWVERAYRAGLRLFVQHATTNEVLCNLIVGLGTQKVRYACDDMVAVDREIQETRNLERYIDAQAGGPGKGWFRVVTSPAQAREAILAGKMAVVLGIETSNLFDCYLTPPDGQTPCDATRVRELLDQYHQLGVRAIFPVHKFDNAFSAGDGDRNVGQLGSFINSGHWSNFVLDCPDVPAVFDHGPVRFGGINKPRDVYDAPAPNDFWQFPVNPVIALFPFLNELQEPPLEGDYCQNAGLTPLGEGLVTEMMKRGMIIEIDHLPRRSYQRAFELLTDADYPPVGTHGNTNRGKVYELGGVSKVNLGRCGDPARAGAMGDGLRGRIAEIVEHGGYPAEGFGFDLNGFAGSPRPRFGPDQQCGDVPQSYPITYPFTSYAGDVTFTEPHLGQRTVDFNTEGMLHIGLLPELIEDARRDGVTDEELEPLFRSAEGYLRMWERAEARGAALSK